MNMLSKSWRLLLLPLLWVTLSGKGGADPLTPPGLPPVPQGPATPVDDTSSYSLSSNVTRTTLPNGLVILVKEIHGSNTVALDLVARVGQAQEDSTNSGVTNLIGRGLQRRVSNSEGTDNNLVEQTGSVMHFNVSPDFTEVAVDTTSEHFHALFTRVLDAYRMRDFKRDEMDFVRNKMLHDLEGEQRVFSAIYDIFLENFYRYHPYREPAAGNSTAIHGLSLEAFNKFYDHYYVPNRTVLAVVGDVNTKEIVQQVTRALADMAPVKDEAKEIQWEPIGSEKELQLAAGSNLAWIFLGYPAPSVKSPDYPAMRVMHALMGEGVSSRLWVDLREERGLAYELGSIYPVLEGPAHFLAYMITTPAQLRQSRRRIFAQMERLRSEDVPATELDQGRWKVIGALLLQQETTAGKAYLLATSEAQGVGYQFSDQFLSAVRQVTSKEVRAVANKYLDNYTLIVARPPGAY